MIEEYYTRRFRNITYIIMFNRQYYYFNRYPLEKTSYLMLFIRTLCIIFYIFCKYVCTHIFFYGCQKKKKKRDLFRFQWMWKRLAEIVWKSCWPLTCWMPIFKAIERRRIESIFFHSAINLPYIVFSNILNLALSKRYFFFFRSCCQCSNSVSHK